MEKILKEKVEGRGRKKALGGTGGNGSQQGKVAKDLREEKGEDLRGEKDLGRKGGERSLGGKGRRTQGGKRA